MFLADLIKSKVQLSTLNSALSQLYSINFFAVLYEIAANTNHSNNYKPEAEAYSLRAAWHDGYTAAIDDIYNFNQKYIHNQTKPTKVTADFGAREALVANKDIEKEEDYDVITRSK